MQPPASQESASLVKRLAGPSTGKAGLANDQTEINRIIAEASKGSKFYDNEKRRDKDLTERIERILKQCEEACRGVDMARIEAHVDHLIAELESHRDLSQVIVHVDMDAFFANVELLDNPDLAGKPFAVGHGVLSTASYEARKYGVRSGMATFIAKKLCPDLILVSSHFARYSELSGKIMSIFRRYDPNMDAAGCDEGYLNITNYLATHGVGAEECVQEMRAAVCKETKLTVSAGIAPNKMLAKNKPNGQFALPFKVDAIKNFMKDLPIRKVPGIGRVNERLLESVDIKARSNVVKPYQRDERKSIGAERTFYPLDDVEQILQKLDEVATELEADMSENGWCGRTVTLKFKLDTHQVFTRAKSFDRWITTKDDLLMIGKELLMPEFPMRIRLIGLRVTKLKDLKALNERKGIRKFFTPIAENSRKRVKLDYVEQHEEAEEMEGGICLEESMPGYHEHDERDEPASQEQESALYQRRSRSPSVAPVEEDIVKALPNPVLGHQTCPICERTFETDNQGLNAHIDFCLSRHEILRAQKESSNSGFRPPKPAKPTGSGHRVKNAKRKRNSS
ncbi:hypothetical protein AX16_005226 [Volvariella volvacea WC 439]|nr:hypothetical protein AX16_005226 [Volvariella volvacea WC 439]